MVYLIDFQLNAVLYFHHDVLSNIKVVPVGFTILDGFHELSIAMLVFDLHLRVPLFDLGVFTLNELYLLALLVDGSLLFGHHLGDVFEDLKSFLESTDFFLHLFLVVFVGSCYLLVLLLVLIGLELDLAFVFLCLDQFKEGLLPFLLYLLGVEVLHLDKTSFFVQLGLKILHLF